MGCALFFIMLHNFELSLRMDRVGATWSVNQAAAPCKLPDLRLCGIGVALSAEAETGQFCTDHVCRSGQKHVKKSCHDRTQNPCTQDLGSCSPFEPQPLMHNCGMLPKWG